jgi:hypothetical protein
VRESIANKTKLRPGVLLVVRTTASDRTHVGIVLDVTDQTFETFEGNTSVEGSRNGTTARLGNRSYPSKDFLSLL